MDVKKIGVFLAELRKDRTLTQDELGEKIGVTNKTVSRWENGNYLPPVEILNGSNTFSAISSTKSTPTKAQTEVTATVYWLFCWQCCCFW